MKKDNISKLKDCYGCGVCIPACPKKIINFDLNKKGFYSPVIHDQDSCIECGICFDVCSFYNDGLSLSSSCDCKASYAIKSKDRDVISHCSSGGVGFEIIRLLITKGYKACLVKYNPDKDRAEHYIADTIKEAVLGMGSKYIPSYSIEGFKEIIRKNQKYVVTGTPCQIDSFRRYIRRYKIEDNFILIDFFCHGVPSYLLWNKYLSEVKKNTGDKLNIRWRNKKSGWYDSYAITASIEERKDRSQDECDEDWRENKTFKMFDKPDYWKKKSDGDLFYKFFLGNYCLNECCYSSCKFKLQASSADIRIGDFWGDKYSRDEDGVSAVMALTDRGKDIINELYDSCDINIEPLEVLLEGQMEKNAQKKGVYNLTLELFRAPISLMKIYKISYYVMRITSKLKKMLS